MTTLPEGLVSAREQVRDELRRADTKATTLLTLVGAVLAGVIALAGRPMPGVAAVALWSAAAPILAAVFVLLSAIRPRLGGAAVGSWLYAAEHGPHRLLAAYSDNDTASAVVTATDVCALAVIARAKYRRVRAAVTLLVIGIGLLVVALVLGQVAR